MNPVADKPGLKKTVSATGEVKNDTGCKDMRDDPVIVKRLIDAITAGNTFANAIILAGIGERTFYRWMAQGERARSKSSKARQFWQKVKEAEAQAVNRNVLCISTAARKSWQAAAWYLERRLPEQWGRKDKVESSGPAGGPIQVNVGLTSRFKSALERAYAQRPKPESANASGSK